MTLGAGRLREPFPRLGDEELAAIQQVARGKRYQWLLLDAVADLKEYLDANTRLRAERETLATLPKLLSDEGAPYGRGKRAEAYEKWAQSVKSGDGATWFEGWNACVAEIRAALSSPDGSKDFPRRTWAPTPEGQAWIAARGDLRAAERRQDA